MTRRGSLAYAAVFFSIFLHYSPVKQIKYPVDNHTQPFKSKGATDLKLLKCNILCSTKCFLHVHAPPSLK